MLKAIGPVGLLNDYKKFADFIMGEDEEKLDELDDFEAFVRTIGALISHDTTDLTQLALREKPESAVYQQAKGLALVRPDRLYLEWTNRSSSSSIRGTHSATILHHGAVKQAAFLADVTKILTCNGTGQIKIWDVLCGEVLHRFTGHKSGVTSVALSPSPAITGRPRSMNAP